MDSTGDGSRGRASGMGTCRSPNQDVHRIEDVERELWIGQWLVEAEFLDRQGALEWPVRPAALKVSAVWEAQRGGGGRRASFAAPHRAASGDQQNAKYQRRTARGSSRGKVRWFVCLTPANAALLRNPVT